jgi:F-type H+-transporting ATPase subunit delta
MANTRAAIRYATAILDLAQSRNVSESVNNDMKTIGDTFASNKELNQFIQSPTISIEAKKDALLEIFASANDTTKGLFHLLFQNKRFSILDTIAIEFAKLYQESIGVQVVQVTTAIPMNADLESKVLAKASTLSNKKIILHKQVDASIIGGFVLTIGDKQYNASVVNRLQQLKKQLSN